MNKIFIYATLKAFKIQEEALGEKHGHKETPALLIGYTERPVSVEHQSWPTLWAMGPNAVTKGDIIEVTDEELAKLDKWEDHYKRIEVKTNKGEAWAYVFSQKKAAVAK